MAPKRQQVLRDLDTHFAHRIGLAAQDFMELAKAARIPQKDVHICLVHSLISFAAFIADQNYVLTAEDFGAACASTHRRMAARRAKS